MENGKWKIPKGFTLIELMVVITIIAILVGVGTFAVENALNRGRDNRRKQELKAVQGALTSYYQDKGYYPPDCNDPGPPPCPAGEIKTLTSDTWDGEFDAIKPYLKDQKLPQDPRQASAFNNLLAMVLQKPKSIATNLLAKLPGFNQGTSTQQKAVNTHPEVAGTTTSKLPGTVTNTIGVGDTVWTNYNNVKLVDSTYATVGVTTFHYSNYIAATNFGFTTTDIPAGSTINGIVVEVMRKESTANLAVESNVNLIKGGIIQVSSNRCPSQCSTNIPITDTSATFGDSTNLWNTTLTTADVTSTNFGVAYAVKGLNTNTIVSVDWIKMTVYYTIPPNIYVSGLTTKTGTSCSTGTPKASYANGEVFHLCGTVGNNSSTTTGGTFNADIYRNQQTQPPATQNGDILHLPNTGPYPGNFSGSLDAPITADASTCTTSCYAAAFIDTTNVIAESNEGDNFASTLYSVAPGPSPTPAPSPTIAPTPAPSPTPTPAATPSPSASPLANGTPEPTPGEFDGAPPPTNPPSTLAPNGATGGTGGPPSSNTHTYNCGTNATAVYCYIVSADRSYFLLWTKLDNLKDNQSVWNGGTQCRYLPPAGTNFNFCLEAQK